MHSHLRAAKGSLLFIALALVGEAILPGSTPVTLPAQSSESAADCIARPESSAGFSISVPSAGGTYEALQQDPPTPPLVGGNQFSMIFLPDTQRYTEDYDLNSNSNSTGNRYAQRFYDQTTWIANSVQAYNIRFVSHVGDIVQNFNNNNSSEWSVARTAMNMLHPANDPRRFPFVPYSVSLGNHDFDTANQTNLSANRFVGEYGPNRFKNAQGRPFSFYKGSDLGWAYVVGNTTLEVGKGYNSYQKFSTGPYEFMHITLQCAATNGSLAWAQTILDANPGMRTIISTHSFLSGGEPQFGEQGTLLTTVDMGRNKPGVTNSADGIWDKLIRTNDQIFMVFCGHAWQQEHVVFQNSRGHDVLIYEACYHLEANGGRISMVDQHSTPWAYSGPDDDDRNGCGWLGLLVFDPDADHVTWYTYSPTLDVWAKDFDAQTYTPVATTYPTGSDVVVRTSFDLNHPRFAP